MSRAATAAWTAANKERVAATKATWYAKNKERCRATRAAWSAKNKERDAAVTAAWAAANRDRRRMYDASRRARKRNQFVENVNPQECYAMHGGMCGICKGFIDGDFHVDHRIPLSKGGMHGYANCQPAHPKCNLSKGDKIVA